MGCQLTPVNITPTSYAFSRAGSEAVFPEDRVLDGMFKLVGTYMPTVRSGPRHCGIQQ